MRIWHLAAIVLVSALLLAAYRDPEVFPYLAPLAGMVPGAAVVACGLALGRLARDQTRHGNETAWLLGVIIVLAIPASAFFAGLLFLCAAMAAGD